MKILLVPVDRHLRHWLVAGIVSLAVLKVLDETAAVAGPRELLDTAGQLFDELINVGMGLSVLVAAELVASRADVKRDGHEGAVDGRLSRGYTALSAKFDGSDTGVWEEVSRQIALLAVLGIFVVQMPAGEFDAEAKLLTQPMVLESGHLVVDFLEHRAPAIILDILVLLSRKSRTVRLRIVVGSTVVG